MQGLLSLPHDLYYYLHLWLSCWGLRKRLLKERVSKKKPLPPFLNTLTNKKVKVQKKKHDLKEHSLSSIVRHDVKIKFSVFLFKNINVPLLSATYG